MIVPVGHVALPGFVDRRRDRLSEACVDSGPVGVSFLAISSKRPDIAVCGDDTNGMVAAITHIEVALRVDGEAVSAIELSHLAVAVGKPGLTTSRKALHPNLRPGVRSTNCAQRKR